MFEISNINGNYADFTIAKRMVDCSSINKENFILFIDEDMRSAVNSYNEISIPRQIEIMTANHDKYIKSCRISTNKTAKIVAEHRWKTENRRNQYIEEVMKKFDEDNNKPYVAPVSNITFFDFDGNCGTKMGITGGMVIDINCSNTTLSTCYDKLITSEFFKKAIGWEFGYHGDSNSYRSCFRPYIKLIFDDDINSTIEAAKNELTESVRNFYKNTTYYGD